MLLVMLLVGSIYTTPQVGGWSSLIGLVPFYSTLFIPINPPSIHPRGQTPIAKSLNPTIYSPISHFTRRKKRFKRSHSIFSQLYIITDTSLNKSLKYINGKLINLIRISNKLFFTLEKQLWLYYCFHLHTFFFFF